MVICLRLLVIVLVIVAIDAQILSKEGCDGVCGANNAYIVPSGAREQFRTSKGMYWSSALREPFSCDSKSERWARLAHSFMLRLGYNVTAVKCPYMNTASMSKTNAVVWSTYRKLVAAQKNIDSELKDGKRLMQLGYTVTRDKEAQECFVQTFHGIRQQKNEDTSSPTENSWYLLFTVIEPLSMSKHISARSEFINIESGATLPLSLNSRPIERCTTLSCGEFSVLKWESKPFRHSLFVQWRNEEVPGFGTAVDEITANTDAAHNAKEDATASNIAILCLPLIMSIPPISLIETVSDWTTLWYVLATDIFSVFPLIIKGGELLIMSGKTFESSSVTTFEVHNDEFAFFETFLVDCFQGTLESWTLQLGFILVTVGIWFMFASTLAEFVFWRGLRIKEIQGPDLLVEDLNASIDNISPETTTLDLEIIGSETESTQVTMFAGIQMGSIVKGRRKWILMLAVCVLASYAVVLVKGQMVCLGKSFSCVAVVCTVALHIITTSSTSDVLHQNFGIGVGVAICIGPLYIAGNVHPMLRRSPIWGQLLHGCNAGCAIWMFVLYHLVTRRMNLDRVLGCLIPSWTYFSVSLTIHVVRSSSKDRRLWKYFGFGFALGCLYGPFSFLFTQCFPDIRGHPWRKRCLHDGFIYGSAMLFTMAILFIRWPFRY